MLGIRVLVKDSIWKARASYRIGWDISMLEIRVLGKDSIRKNKALYRIG
jgi:hypothetical protein